MFTCVFLYKDFKLKVLIVYDVFTEGGNRGAYQPPNYNRGGGGGGYAMNGGPPQSYSQPSKIIYQIFGHSTRSLNNFLGHQKMSNQPRNLVKGLIFALHYMKHPH